MATIDNLQIEITANADKAAQGMDRLARVLSSLKTASNIKKENLQGVASGFRSINNAIQKIDLTSVKRVERLADALSRLAAIKPSVLRNVMTKGIDSELAKTETKPKAVDSGVLKTSEEEIEGTADAVDKASESTSSAYANFMRLSTATKDAKKSAADFMKQWQFFSTLARYTSSFFKSILPDFSKLHTLLRRIISPLKSFISSIGRIALYRGIRSVIKTIAAGIKEGVQNLAMFSKQMNEMDTHSANRVMSLYTSNFLYLKNAIATAVIPILKTLEPIVDRLIVKFIDFINVIAQLMSVLSGSTTYTKAKYYYKDYAEEMDKASGSAAKLNKQLAKFDELNNLTTSGGGGSGSKLPDYSKMFEDPVPIEKWIQDLKNKNWFEIGRTISDKIASALENIDWENIKNKAAQLGTKLASLVNGFFTPRLFGNIGTTIAEGLNTALRFLYNFGVEFDAHEFMYSIVTGITKFFETFDFALLAETLNVWVDNLKDAIKGAIDGITDADWKKIGSNIFSFFSHLELDTVALIIGVITVATVGKVLKWVFGSGVLAFLGQSLGLYIAQNGLTVTLSQVGVTIGQIGGVLLKIIGFLGTALSYVAAFALTLAAIWQTWISILEIVSLISGKDVWGKSAEEWEKWSLLSLIGYDQEEVYSFWETVFDFWGKEIPGYFKTYIVDSFVNGFKFVFGKGDDEATNAATRMYNAFADKLGLPTWTGLFGTIKETFMQIWDETLEFWEPQLPGIIDEAKKIFSYDEWIAVFTNISDSFKDDMTVWLDYWDDNTTKWWEKVLGLFDYATWKDTLSTIPDAFKEAFNSAGKFVQDILNNLIGGVETFVKDVVSGIGAIINAKAILSGEADSFTMPTISFPRINLFASGGYPIQGSMFIAGERGAELVGNIGGKTGVANTDNITEAMYGATYDAMTRALSENGMSVTLEGDARRIFKVVQNEAVDFMNRTQTAPFPT